MKALAITHVFPRWQGDVQAPFILDWAKALQRQDVDIRILAPHDKGAAEAEILEGIPVRRVRYGFDSWETVAYRGNMHKLVRSPKGVLQLGAMASRTVVAIRSAVQAFDPDVVHVHWWVPSMVLVAAANINVPIVTHLHGTDVVLAQNNAAVREVMKWSVQKADRVEAVSTHLAALASDILDRPVQAVNPMPLSQTFLDSIEAITVAKQTESASSPGAARFLATNDFKNEFPTLDEDAATDDTVPFGTISPQESAEILNQVVIDTEQAVILAIGRLVEEKGFMDLVYACAQQQEPVELRIIGEGPLRSALEQTAKQLEVNLVLPGSMPHDALIRQYLEADVVVQPSHHEGYGIVAAEAVLLGKPVVATNAGGVADVLPYHTLVTPGNTDKLAQAIAQELEDPSLEKSMMAASAITSQLSFEESAMRTLLGWRAARKEHQTRE